MGTNFFNPVNRGLITGVDLWQRIQRTNMAQGDQQLQQEQEARVAENQRAQQEAKDLATQIRLHDRHARPATPMEMSQQDFPDTGIEGSPPPGGPSLEGRMVEHDGRTYVLPTHEEELERKIKDTSEISKAASDDKILALRKEIEETGIPIDPKWGKQFGLEPGQKIPPQYLDDVMRAITAYQKQQADATKRGTPRASGQGDYVYEGGEVRFLKDPKSGERIKSSTAGGEGSLAQERHQLNVRKQDETEERRQRERIDELVEEENKLHGQRAAYGKMVHEEKWVSRTDPTKTAGLGHKSAGASMLRERIESITARLIQILEEKHGLGAVTDEDYQTGLAQLEGRDTSSSPQSSPKPKKDPLKLY